MIQLPAGSGFSCYRIITEAEMSGYTSVKGKIPSGTLTLVFSSFLKGKAPSPAHPAPLLQTTNLTSSNACPFLTKKQPGEFCK